MGVEIGDHVLIGAHSFVNDNLPSNSVAIGCPAKTIGVVKVRGGEVEIEYMEKN